MNDTTMRLDWTETEEDTLTYEVSDAGLESAAGSTNEKANFTLGACTGLSVCPG